MKISSKHLHSQTVRARELTFWEKVHLPPPLTCKYFFGQSGIAIQWRVCYYGATPSCFKLLHFDKQTLWLYLFTSIKAPILLNFKNALYHCIIPLHCSIALYYCIHILIKFLKCSNNKYIARVWCVCQFIVIGRHGQIQGLLYKQRCH